MIVVNTDSQTVTRLPSGKKNLNADMENVAMLLISPTFPIHVFIHNFKNPEFLPYTLKMYFFLKKS